MVWYQNHVSTTIMTDYWAGHLKWSDDQWLSGFSIQLKQWSPYPLQRDKWLSINSPVSTPLINVHYNHSSHKEPSHATGLTGALLIVIQTSCHDVKTHNLSVNRSARSWFPNFPPIPIRQGTWAEHQLLTLLNMYTIPYTAV